MEEKVEGFYQIRAKEIEEGEINKRLWKANNSWHNTHAENAQGYIKYLASAIQEYYLGLLPKKENINRYDKGSRSRGYQEGYNQAIQDMRSSITGGREK